MELSFVKFSYFHKEQKTGFKNAPSAYKTCFTTKKKTFMSVRWGNVWRKCAIPNAPVAMVMSQLLVFIRQKTAKVVHSEECVIKLKQIGEWKSIIGSTNSKRKQEHYC